MSCHSCRKSVAAFQGGLFEATRRDRVGLWHGFRRWWKAAAAAAVRDEVGGEGWWDDPDGVELRARFMAFTGQRRDWPQHKLLFWKDVLLRVARSLRLCSTPAHLVSRQLKDSHRTSTCIVTISKFNTFFLGLEDSHAMSCYLTQCGKAQYIVDRKQERFVLFVVHYCSSSALLYFTSSDV
ncbi:hypothetical protein ABZP36_015358 [Zizania latifolia]